MYSAVICCIWRSVSQTFRWLATALWSHSNCSKLSATVTVLAPTRRDH